MEIEKRYDVNKDEIPINDIKSKIYIEQVYSVIGNNKGIPDVRIRKTEENGKSKYFNTVKYKTENKNSRVEIEQEIGKDDYDKIFKLIDKKPVRKNRYLIPIGDNLMAEVDEFLDTNKIIVEVEFPDIDTMDNFTPPKWFSKEIKGKQSFNAQVFSMINSDISIKFY